MMISKFNGIVVSNEGNSIHEFSFIGNKTNCFVVEYTTGDRHAICFRNPETGCIMLPTTPEWLEDDGDWWIEAIHQYVDGDYHHGVVITDGIKKDLIAIVEDGVIYPF